MLWVEYSTDHKKFPVWCRKIRKDRGMELLLSFAVISIRGRFAARGDTVQISGDKFRPGVLGHKFTRVGIDGRYIHL
jgi:hypothetical protein